MKKSRQKRPCLGRVLELRVADGWEIPPTVTLRFFVCDATHKQAVEFAQDMLNRARCQGKLSEEGGFEIEPGVRGG